MWCGLCWLSASEIFRVVGLGFRVSLGALLVEASVWSEVGGFRFRVWGAGFGV